MSAVTKYVPAGRRTVQPGRLEPGAQPVALGLQVGAEAIRSRRPASPSACAIACWNGAPLTKVRNCLAVWTARDELARPASPSRSSSR